MKFQLLVSLLLIVAMSFGQGCASYMMYQHNKSAYKDEAVPVSRVIGDNMGSSTAALAVDAVTLIGAYQGIKAIQGDSNNSQGPDNGKKANNNTAGENVTVIQGNNNTVNVNSGDTIPVVEAPIE